MSYDLIIEMQTLFKNLETSLKSLRKTGNAYAQAEYDYKVLLSKESLRLRDEGMAIGMIDKVIYGLPSVAKARLERDIAETVYKANQEAINVYKLRIKMTDSQISREWSGTNA